MPLFEFLSPKKKKADESKSSSTHHDSKKDRRGSRLFKKQSQDPGEPNPSSASSNYAGTRKNRQAERDVQPVTIAKDSNARTSGVCCPAVPETAHTRTSAANKTRPTGPGLGGFDPDDPLGVRNYPSGPTIILPRSSTHNTTGGRSKRQPLETETAKTNDSFIKAPDVESKDFAINTSAASTTSSTAKQRPKVPSYPEHISRPADSYTSSHRGPGVTSTLKFIDAVLSNHTQAENERTQTRTPAKQAAAEDKGRPRRGAWTKAANLETDDPFADQVDVSNSGRNFVTNDSYYYGPI